MDKTASFSQLSSDLKCVGSFRSKRLFTGGGVRVADGGGGDKMNVDNHCNGI